MSCKEEIPHFVEIRITILTMAHTLWFSTDVCKKSIEPLELAISAGNLSPLFIAFIIVFSTV
jgi:hypothetical protein